MAIGKNKQDEYLSRIKHVDGDIIVFCKHCETWHDQSNFHKSKDRFKSICKECHRSKYSVSAGYRSPSSIKASIEAKKKRDAWLAEIQTCTICGEKKPRLDFYDKSQNRYLPYCCSTRRTWDQIDQDIKEQMKTCFECGLRLPFDEFGRSPNSRDKKKPYCKCCAAAIMKSKSDRRDRLEQVEATDDGTATVSALSKMLRETEHCSHCGVRMTQSYPVTPANKTIDHNIPLSRGGGHTLSNLVVMCLGCNSAKADRTLDEFTKYVKKKRNML